MKQVFTANQFTPTQWSTAREKADFGNWLVHFIEQGAPITLFHKAKYQRLSMCFGHIAHYNKQGFHDTWFANGTREWRSYITNWVSFGDPAWTYSDVEREVIYYFIEKAGEF